MVDINDIYPSSKSLKAEDLKGRTVRVTVKDYTVREFESGKKLVLSFHGKEKTFVVNKTNAMIIGAAFGSNPDGWVDHELELFSGKTTYQGKLVDGLQVRIPTPAEDPDDKIPF